MYRKIPLPVDILERIRQRAAAKHGVHALIANSPEEFARLFEELIFDPARRCEIGALAREFVRVNFDPATLAARLVSVYSQTAESYAQGRLRQSA